MLVSPNIRKILRAGRSPPLPIFKRYCKSGFCYLSREGQKIYHKGFCYAIFFASLLFRLINANISVNDFNEQPEWFHWAHRRCPFYTYCTSCTRFKSWSFYWYCKHFGDLDQWPWHVEKNIEKDTTEIVYDNFFPHITELEDTRPVFILFYLLVIKDNDLAVKIWPGRVRGIRQSFSHHLSHTCCLLWLDTFLLYYLSPFTISTN